MTQMIEKFKQFLFYLTKVSCNKILGNIATVNKVADKLPEFKNSRTYLDFLDELNKISVRCQIYMDLEKLSKMLLEQVEWLIKECEANNLTNSQWYIEFEDNLNLLSVKDHNAVKH